MRKITDCTQLQLSASGPRSTLLGLRQPDFSFISTVHATTLRRCWFTWQHCATQRYTLFIWPALLPLRNQFKVIPWIVHSVQETCLNFLRRPTRVDNTAHNADITQSLAANQHRLLSNVTLGFVEYMK